MSLLKQEVFAVGTWNGFPFTLNDLRKMAASFVQLKDVLKVPLKLGHNDEQEVTDGQPSLGWVTALEVIGEKLVATFEDVPSIMVEAFDKKLYRTVSIELDFDVMHKGTAYDFVVTAVALLGADMPAVNTLNDLGAFLASRNSNLAQGGYAASSHKTFSTISGNRKEQSTMTPEEEAALRLELATATASNLTLTASVTDLTAKVEKQTVDFAKQEQDRKDASTKVEAGIARAKYTQRLETAVKDKIITPAQREAYTALLALDDDEKVLALDEKQLDALIGKKKEPDFARDTAGEDNGDDNDDDKDPDESLTQKAYAHMEKSDTKDFSRSLDIVMKANPELARDYVNSNGEVVS